MFLKSLEIRGFKSFADKTELRFKKGVTAVVGPNGSGKSNISDAVRWVLGEQSVKTLRGGKMEDVIFAGTQYRKAVGLAQVSLTLENEDGFLDTEYNEVTISRRIFRSGETEYLINNSKARLKDITALFMDTGIGKEGYSLIGQGKIEAILSGRPEERRNLLEEAAGIVKFKSRKTEAEKKLSNTDENLIRIRDIIGSYEERLEPLRIEKEKALKFKDLSEELKEREVSLLVRNISYIEDILTTINKEMLNNTQILEKKRIILNEKRVQIKKIEEELESLEKSNTDKKFRYFKKKEDITKFSGDIKISNERINNFNSKLEKNKIEKITLERKVEKFENLKKELENRLFESNEDRKKREDEIQKLESENRGYIEKIREIEKVIESIKNEEKKSLKIVSETENKISTLKERVKARELDKERLIENIENAKGNNKINSATYTSLTLKINSLDSSLENLVKELNEDKIYISKLNSYLSKKEIEIKGKTIEINRFEANYNILKDLENQYEGYNKSLKNLMEKIEKGEAVETEGISVLGDIFEVDSKYEVAIETALGGAISNVITDRESIAKNLVNYLKKNKLGRITFLPLDVIRGSKVILDKRTKDIEGYLGIASEVIRFDKKYEKAVDYALGRTIIAKDMDSAFLIAKNISYKYRVVTLDGEILNAGGALTGGTIKGRNTSILSRKREIEELSVKIVSKKRELEEVKEEFESKRDERKIIDEKVLNITDKIHGTKIELATSKNELNNISNEIEKINNVKNNYKKQLDNIKINLDEIVLEIKDREKMLENLISDEDSNKEKLDNYFKEVQNLRKLLEDKKNIITEFRIKKAALDEVHNNNIRELEKGEKEFREDLGKIKILELEKKDSLENIEFLKRNIENLQNEIEGNEKDILALENQFREDELTKEKNKENFKLLDSNITEIRELISKDEGELNKKEIVKARHDIEKDNYYKKLNEEYSLTLAQAQELSKPIEDINKFRETITNLKRRITSIGIVNLASIEEYDEVKEKFEFMTNQELDLEKSKEELLKVIEEMTFKMKLLFKENFKILNKNFNETFKELFKGGSAQLILGEGDELSADIHINVEPPGKKLQNINLMSGGEKVLSAIALLFGILKMKPTPFCILDEIEAALDDANVNRYAEFLKEFSENIQFIVITHRKGTMQVSDIMYGVTMEEKGISKVVSVDMRD